MRPLPLLSARVPKLRPARTQVDAFERLGPGNYHRIARSSGLSLTHVTRVLRGLRGVSFPVAGRLAEGAGVTTDQLLAYLRANEPIDRVRRRPRQSVRSAA